MICQCILPDPTASKAFSKWSPLTFDGISVGVIVSYECFAMVDCVVWIAMFVKVDVASPAVRVDFSACKINYKQGSRGN